MHKQLAELLFPNNTLKIEEIEAKYKNRNLKEGAYVTRFAPSPTGFMHIGNLYGAFISFQLAKQTNGVFYLRVEDTDSKREKEGAIDAIINGLLAYDINYDEGYGKSGDYAPYIQSERKEIYKSYAKKLVSEGKAYPCFMSEEEINDIRNGQELRKEKIGIYGPYAVDRDLSLDEVKKHLENGDSYVIRLKSMGDSHNEVILHDLIKGDISLPENDIDEVILKKDGIPTYHFAHVVDDHLMHTTHVLRGDEWVPSFPKHLQLNQALGFKPCKYAHIAPLTKKEDGKIRKFSKRKDPEFAVSYYEEEGIPKEGVKLYLATLANTNFEEWYLQNKDKDIKDFKFSFKKMPTGGTLFDVSKLNNICRTYFSRITAIKIYDDALKYYEKFDNSFATIMKDHKDKLISFLNIERNSNRPRKDIATYKDIKKESFYLFNELFYQDKEISYQNITEDIDGDLIKEYINIYKDYPTEDEWYMQIKEFALKMGYAPNIKMYKEDPSLYKGHIGDVCEMIRHTLTGRIKTPNLYQLLKILGIDELKNRLEFYQKEKI